MLDLIKMMEAMREEPWATWMIVADAMEEAGDKRADGLRMLAKFKLYPQNDHASYKEPQRWFWQCAKKRSRKFYGSFLPYQVCGEKIMEFVPKEGYYAIRFEDPIDAVLTAAAAWAEILPKRPLKSGRK